MISLLRKKRRTTRRNMLHWMQDSIRLSVGMGCLWGFSSFGLAADMPPTKAKSPSVGRAAVDAVTVAGAKKGTDASVGTNAARSTNTALTPARSTRQVIRAQNAAQNPFEEEVAIEASKNVIPPPAPTKPSTPPTEADALKRLRDRSAKARWDQLHQEWLKARKSRNPTPNPDEPQAPAAEQPAAEQAPVEGAPAETNPFEADSVPAGTSADPNLPPPAEATEPALEGGARQPNVPAKPVLLQNQPKPREQLPSEEEINKLLNLDNGQRLPPPVRDPGALPRITQIKPYPDEASETPGSRPIPEQDPKRYVQLGNTPYQARANPEMTYSFEATNVWSNPLYFEDPALERYGHTLPPVIQPIASVARFGVQTVFLPYQMAVKPLDAKIYPLGWYSPGDYVPYRFYRPGYNLRGIAVEAATILGVGYATP